ncbi:alpha/beta hydrolase [Sanguibacter sp. 25GB23B1]|uniref:alpha/beta fold hydrolase n=1 Tax=unclassified Sanguibacter TaxID=2645534 RepID=UPI0032AFEB89
MTSQPSSSAPARPTAAVDTVVEIVVGPLDALRARPVGRARGTVLLVPGFTGSKDDFAPLLPLLADAGWDTWTYSQRGQAGSVAPDGVPSYSLDAFAGDLLEVVAVVGDGAPVHLVGHSFGGLVARAAVIARPEVFLDVVLLCSGPRGWGAGKNELLRVVDASGSLGLWERDHPELVDVDPAVLGDRDAFLRRRAQETSSDNLRGIIEILWDPTDRTEELRATGVRTLVARGETDEAWPPEWQRQMALALGAPYEIIPAAGHCPAEENPVATAALLDRCWRG